MNDLNDARAFEDLAREATKCRECFALGEVEDPSIDVAQPSWVGPKYWTVAFRVVILMCNPGQSSEKNSDWAKGVRHLLHEFRDGMAPLSSVLESQRDAMAWSRFYIDGLALNVDEIGFANVAWCASKNNLYPETMLQRCFKRHTGRLLQLLRPTVVVVAGRKAAQVFEGNVAEPSTAPKVIRVLHHAHRKGHSAEQGEFTRVRAELRTARERAG